MAAGRRARAKGAAPLVGGDAQHRARKRRIEADRMAGAFRLGRPARTAGPHRVAAVEQPDRILLGDPPGDVSLEHQGQRDGGGDDLVRALRPQAHRHRLPVHQRIDRAGPGLGAPELRGQLLVGAGVGGARHGPTDAALRIVPDDREDLGIGRDMGPCPRLEHGGRRAARLVQPKARQHVLVDRELEAQRLLDPERVGRKLGADLLGLAAARDPDRGRHQRHQRDDGHQRHEREQIHAATVRGRIERPRLARACARLPACPLFHPSSLAPPRLRQAVVPAAPCGNPQ